jgi:hypothetical protein
MTWRGAWALPEEYPMTQDKDRKAAIRARMAETGEPYAEAARQLRRQPGAGDPYGYDPATDTLRVSRHDLARLLLQFREELERDPGRQWSHMADYDISFERLADAVDYARAHLPPELRAAGTDGPDDRMRCKRTPVYRWPVHRPVETLKVRAAPSRGASHYAWWDRHDFGQALCGFTFTRDDGVSPAGGEPSCPECVREKRLSAGHQPEIGSGTA